MKCCHCEQEKPETDFYMDRSRPSGRKPRCKPCDLLSRDKAKRAEYEKAYWATRRPHRRQIVLESHNRNSDHHKAKRQEYLQTPAGRVAYRKQTQTRYARKKEAFVEIVSPKQIYLAQGGFCYICAVAFSFSEMECDHVIPLARAGFTSLAIAKWRA